MLNKTRLVLLALLILTACAPAPKPPLQTTITENPSMTLEPSQVLSPSPELPSPTATFEPISGTTLFQVNIRSGPGLYYDQIGKLDQGKSVQVIARDAASTWLAILFPQGSNQIGWSSAQYINVASLDQLPVLNQVFQDTQTPAPEGLTTQKVNIRKGPGGSFDSLGILSSGSVLWLLGRNASSDWLLVDFPKGPEGKGWVLADYVQVNDLTSLPVYDSKGNHLVITSTPEVPGVPGATATFLPAPADNDSLTQPEILIQFSPLSSGSFIYTSALSSPTGDHEDWLAFIPYALHRGGNSPVSISLTCSGNGTVQVDLYQAANQVTGWGSASCGEINHLINLSGLTTYTFHIEIKNTSNPASVIYSITVRNSP